jgi:hypothetical protein
LITLIDAAHLVQFDNDDKDGNEPTTSGDLNLFGLSQTTWDFNLLCFSF